MANNYRGIFWGLDDKKYQVDIIGNTGSSDYVSFELAADNPFLVNYAVSNTPFEPVRTSTAQINIVHNDYMEDILSAEAQGTKIQLTDITNSGSTVIKWTGYLTPKIYDAPYRDEYETYQLEAADCVSSLQYVDFALDNGDGIVSFHDILAQICNACGSLDGFYWTRSKKVGSAVLLPEHVHISEHNFLYSDTLEPLKLSEVLEETCRYFGFTALQWGTYLYFIDYQYLSANSDIYATRYLKSSGYNAGSATHLSSPFTVSGDTYQASDAQITFEPVYNKVEVRANFYPVDMYIPSIVDDAFLKNRNGDFYSTLEVKPVAERGHWYYGTVLGITNNNYEDKEHLDTNYTFRHRYYDHKYWESVYSNINNGNYVTPGAASATTAITRDYRGGTIVDMGVVEEHKNASQQWVVPSKMDYTRYLCIRTGHNNNLTGMDNVVFRLKDGFKGSFIGTGAEFLVINYSCLWEKYGDRNYINPEWSNQTLKSRPAGSHYAGIGRLRFRLGIGGKYWSGSAWSNTSQIFSVEAEWDVKSKGWKGPDCWNTDLSVLNNVSWEEELNCSGYKIPLTGVDLSQDIVFEVINPSRCVYGNTGNPRFEDYNNEYNAFLWVKSLTFDLVRKSHEDKEENDVVYSNVISSGSVSELQTMTCKITTDTDLVQPSYSNVGYQTSSSNGMVALSSVTEDAISGTAQKPEENIIEKFVLQYRTPTSKIKLPQPIEIAPYQIIYGVDVDSPSQKYVQLGTEIDYSMGRQTITAVEKK